MKTLYFIMFSRAVLELGFRADNLCYFGLESFQEPQDKTRLASGQRLQ